MNFFPEIFHSFVNFFENSSKDFSRNGLLNSSRYSFKNFTRHCFINFVKVSSRKSYIDCFSSFSMNLFKNIYLECFSRIYSENPSGIQFQDSLLENLPIFFTNFSKNVFLNFLKFFLGISSRIIPKTINWKFSSGIALERIIQGKHTGTFLQNILHKFLQKFV